MKMTASKSGRERLKNFPEEINKDRYVVLSKELMYTVSSEK